MFERTQHGRVILFERVLKAIRNQGHEPVGKLLVRTHIEEVVENDGNNGRDLWCIVGRMVYDITGTFVPYEGSPASQTSNSC